MSEWREPGMYITQVVGCAGCGGVGYRIKPLSECIGNGRDFPGQYRECSVCHGSGRVSKDILLKDALMKLELEI